MSASVPIEGSLVVGAMTPPTSKAPFNRAQLIVRAGDDTLVRVQTYTSEGCAEGPVLTAEELQGLIEAGHAIELSESIPLVSGALLWVLRPGLPRRDRALQDLRSSGVLVHSPLVGHDDAKLCIVNESEAGASALLDRWRDEAMTAARVHARRGEWDHARIDMEIAQAVSRGLDADVIAFLSFVYERCGRTERASGLLTMARRSRGEDFEAEVIVALRRFRGTRSRPPRSSMEAALQKCYSVAAQSLGSHPSRLVPAPAY
jgi:hypothetical protein